MGGLATHGEVPAAIRLAQHHPDLGHQRRARRAGIPGQVERVAQVDERGACPPLARL